MEPYNPDAVDADGDGIVQEWTPWERPGGTRLLDGTGNAIEKGTVLTQRPKNLKVVDKDGKVVNYTPTYSGGALGAGIASGGGAKAPSAKKPPVKPTPLAEHGAPSLREMGLDTVRSASDPTPEPAPQPPVSTEDQAKKSRWKLLSSLFDKGALWLDTRDWRGKERPVADVKKDRLKSSLTRWRSSFGDSYLLAEAAISDFDPEYEESHMAKTLVEAIEGSSVRRWSVRVDSRMFELGQVVDFPLISTGATSEMVSGFEGFNDIFGASDPRGVYVTFINAPSLPHMIGDQVDEREFLLSGQFRVVSVRDFTPPWENRPGSPVALRGKRKSIEMEYIGPSKEVRVDGRSEGRLPPPEPLTPEELGRVTIAQLAQRFGGETGAALRELDALIQRFKDPTGAVGSKEELEKIKAQIIDLQRRLDPNKWDYERGGFAVLNDLWEGLGYRGSAQMVTDQEFYALAAEQRRVLYRGVKNAEDGKTAREIHEQLWSGELWQGDGVYGQGTYFAGSAEVPRGQYEDETDFDYIPDTLQSRIDAIEHTREYGFLTTNAILSPDAKVIGASRLGLLRERISGELVSRKLSVEDLPGLRATFAIHGAEGMMLENGQSLDGAIRNLYEDAIPRMVLADPSSTASLLGYDVTLSTANNMVVLNRTKLISDGTIAITNKMIEHVESADERAADRRIEARNKEILEAIEESGSEFGNPDQSFVQSHSSGANGLYRVRTAEELTKERRQKQEKVLTSIRDIITGNAPAIDDEDIIGQTIRQKIKSRFDKLPTDLKEKILTSDPKELVAELERAAAEFHSGISPSVHVQMPLDRLDAFIDDGRFKTTHEVSSNVSPSYLRREYETTLGYDPAAPPELRPASGYVLHEDWEGDGGFFPVDLSHSGDLGKMHGSVQIKLREKVSERSKFGNGDSLINAILPVGFDEEDESKIANALTYSSGEAEVHNAIVAMEMLRGLHQGDFIDADFGTYLEALIPGAFSLDEVEQITIPMLDFSREISRVRPTFVGGEAVARLDPDKLQDMGFSETEIRFLYGELNQGKIAPFPSVGLLVNLLEAQATKERIEADGPKVVFTSYSGADPLSPRTYSLRASSLEEALMEVVESSLLSEVRAAQQIDDDEM